jgi:hypothetical protein
MRVLRLPAGGEAARFFRAASLVSTGLRGGTIAVSMQFGRRSVLLVEDEESITSPSPKR